MINYRYVIFQLVVLIFFFSVILTNYTHVPNFSKIEDIIFQEALCRKSVGRKVNNVQGVNLPQNFASPRIPSFSLTVITLLEPVIQPKYLTLTSMSSKP